MPGLSSSSAGLPGQGSDCPADPAMEGLILSVCLAATLAPSTATASNTTEPPPATTRRTQPLWNATYTDRLKHDLLLGYDKFARPHEHYNTTSVSLALSIKHVNLDEFTSILNIEAWMRLFWIDSKLTWNASRYGNLSQLNLAEHEVWQPDLVLYNGMTSTGYMTGRYDTGQVVLHQDGTVLWVPMTRLDVFCPLDLRTWPLGEHTCSLKIGSWVHSSTQLNLTMADYDPVSVEMHSEGGPWEVVRAVASRHSALYPCCPDEYVDVTYNVTVKRKYVAYRSVILAPASVSIILCLTSFWLPPLSAQKIFVGGVNAIVICIFLAYIAHLVPILTEHTPYVVLLYVWTLYLVCAYMVVAVVVAALARLQRPCPLAHALRSWGGHPLLCLLVPHQSSPNAELQETQAILCMESATESSGPADLCGVAGAAGASLAQRRDWTTLAAAVDRILFLVFCIAFIVIAICLS